MKLFHHNPVNYRLDKKLFKRKQKRLDQQNELSAALAHPDDLASYNNAIRAIRIKQHLINLKAFAQWLVIDLLWLLLPYFAYAFYEQAVQMIYQANAQLSSIQMWGLQQQLTIKAFAYGAMILLSGYRITQKGWFHRPYRNTELIDWYKQRDYSVPAPTTTHSDPNQSNPHPKTNQKHRRNHKR